jgi:hypothetical protein
LYTLHSFYLLRAQIADTQPTKRPCYPFSFHFLYFCGEAGRKKARSFCGRVGVAMAGDESDESLTEYERQRLSRIRENEARFEALGLRGLAASPLLRNPSPAAAAKGKQKKRSADEDEEYVPSDDGRGEEEEDSSSESGQDEEMDGEGKSASRSRAKVPLIPPFLF